MTAITRALKPLKSTIEVIGIRISKSESDFDKKKIASWIISFALNSWPNCFESSDEFCSHDM